MVNLEDLYWGCLELRGPRRPDSQALKRRRSGKSSWGLSGSQFSISAILLVPPSSIYWLLLGWWQPFQPPHPDGVKFRGWKALLLQRHLLKTEEIIPAERPSYFCGLKWIPWKYYEWLKINQDKGTWKIGIDDLIYKSRNRDIDVVNKHTGTSGEGWDGMNWDTGVDIYALLILCIK